MTEGARLRFARYPCGSTLEPVLARGPLDGPQLLFVPPLFEEMNRCRALIADMMRALAARGFGCWLPDLPGTGESERPLAAIGWTDWPAAVAEAAAHVARQSGRTPACVSLRGGALVDGEAEVAGRWHFAPVAGAGLWRDLVRARLAAGMEGLRDSAAAIAAASETSPVELAGYVIAPALSAGLRAAEPQGIAPRRTVRLASDAGDADLKVEGPALWRQSEPGRSPELAARLAEDIADWSNG